VKRLASLGLLFIVGVALAAQQKAPQDKAGAIAAVQRLERAWLDAYEKHDAAAMDAIVAGDFLITFPNGQTQTKKDLMAMIKAPPRPGQSSKWRTENVVARQFGQTVVLTGRVVGEHTSGAKTSSEASLYTDTYVKLNGRWQVVASHLSNVPERKP
jgi:ketosteroid isomerase-like protein